MSFIIAIDGPAGTGKGTITKIIADKYGFTNIDTGAIYRCVTLEMINNKIKIDDNEKIRKLLNDIEIEEKDINGKLKIYLNGKDVTEQIRSKEVNQIVSQVSGIRQVRLAMANFQRQLGLQHEKSILEGRDIGSFVFPDADVKIYLDATTEERTLRRLKQNKELGIESSYEEIYQNIKMRDGNDKAKEIGALKIAEDAIVIDTTELSINEVVEKVSKIIDEKLKGEHS